MVDQTCVNMNVIGMHMQSENTESKSAAVLMDLKTIFTKYVVMVGIACG